MVLASLIAVLLGLALLLLLGSCVPFHSIRQHLDDLAGDGSADAFTPAVHSSYRTAGLILSAALGIAGLWLLRVVLYSADHRIFHFVGRFTDDSRDVVRSIWQQIRRSWLWLTVLIVVAGAVRLPYLHQPMRYDEAHTFVRYASQPVSLIVTQYAEPNNHVLHSLCVHLSTTVFGNSPAAIRLPAFAAGLVLSPLLYSVALSVTDVRTAKSASLLAAVAPNLIFYSVNARGYTLACALVLLAVLSTLRSRNAASPVAWVFISGTLVMALWTTPAMIYAAVAVLSWNFCLPPSSPYRSGHRRRIILAACAIVTATGLLYLPILLNIGTDRFLNFGRSSAVSWTGFVSDIFPAARQFYEWCFQGIPDWLRILFALALLFGTVCCERSARASILCAVTPVAVLLSLQRVIPPHRIWCFVIPFLCLIVACQLHKVVRWCVKSPRADLFTNAIVALIVCGSAGHMHASQFIKQTNETGGFHDGPEVAEYLASVVIPTEPIIAIAPVSAVLVYYAESAQISRNHFAPPEPSSATEQRHSAAASAIVVTSTLLQQSTDDVLKELGWDHQYSSSGATLLKSFPSAHVIRISRR